MGADGDFGRGFVVLADFVAHERVVDAFRRETAPEALRLPLFERPEHLELAVADPEPLLGLVECAGAVFCGPWAPAVVGDYVAGPNHVLPTSGTARFSSPLGVYDFQKRSSVIGVSAAGAKRLGAIASTLAHGEGLTAHARAAEYRMNRGA